MNFYPVTCKRSLWFYVKIEVYFINVMINWWGCSFFNLDFIFIKLLKYINWIGIQRVQTTQVKEILDVIQLGQNPKWIINLNMSN